LYIALKTSDFSPAVLIKGEEMLKKLLSIATAVLLLTFVAKDLSAQAGIGTLQLNIDNVTVFNGGQNETGSAVAHGSQLTGLVSVSGVTGNGGSTTVTCYDSTNGTTILNWTTSVSGSKQFTWTVPSQIESQELYCEAVWSGQHFNGSATTATATVPVN
jgi:hypothetical protein